ncbi:Ppx/GppA family phosphatase [Caldimonas tepidiphila]|uniref:Ppx/GppA family phosphatase n=1 Tax=Caldimonas tepidiphila TaxID=2315841 RepID=UPI00196B3722|nr:Ppx/GppA family phosphatase [Caldimonas tepidiphila]
MTRDNALCFPSLEAIRSASATGPIAAVDLGSNSFRLEIARFEGGRYRHLETLKESVLLGCGLDPRGVLAEAAMQRGLACLERFARRIEDFGCRQVRAVATQALREAVNREAFLQAGTGVLGHPIEVISGHEEARLIYAGVAGLSPAEGRRRLVVDIGGRSTEMILGEGRTALRAESFPIGCGNLSARFFPSGRFTRAGFRAAQAAAEAALRGARDAFASGDRDEALGSSGTVHTVSQLLSAQGVTDGALTTDGLHWCVERCIEAGSAAALELAGLKENRREMLGGGLALLAALLECFDIGRLRPTPGELRQGLIFELAACVPAPPASRAPEAGRHEALRPPQPRPAAGAALSQAAGT